MAWNKKTHEQFVKEVYELVGDEYSVLGSYIRNDINIDFIHNKCGHVYSVRPGNFIQGKRCPKCMDVQRGLKKRNPQNKFIEKIKVKFNGVIEVLDDYITRKHEMSFRCINCDITFQTKPESILSNSTIHGCPSCALHNMPQCKPKTTDIFKQEVYDLVGDEYVVLGEYVTSKDKVKIKHNCGNVYGVTPGNFLSGKRCPKCSIEQVARKTAKTHDMFISEVNELVGHKYSVLGHYENANKKITVKHNECGFEYEVSPANFLNGKRCPKCFGNIIRTTNSYKKEVYDLVGDEYTVLGEYKSTHEMIKMRHNKCSNNYEVRAGNFLTGVRCPKCRVEEVGELRRKTPEKFREEVFERVGVEYTVLTEYTIQKNKVKIRHNICGHEHYYWPNGFLTNSTRCPRCAESKGERRICEILEKRNVKFVRQYKLNECKNKRRLPFDFAVLDEYDNLIFLIEYDGEQHFKERDYFGGKQGFEYTRKNDSIKNDFCKAQGIELIRIPYTEFENIEKIILSKLNIPKPRINSKMW